MIKVTATLCLLLSFISVGLANEKIKVMLLTGQSNKYHSWQGNSEIILHHLDAAGIFEVDTVTAPSGGEDFSGFAPKWSDYQTVVLDYDGEEWPEATKQSFVEYIKNGGGLVCMHGTNNSFAYWPEFLEMTGLGGWGGAGLYDPKLTTPPVAATKHGDPESTGSGARLTTTTKPRGERTTQLDTTSS